MEETISASDELTKDEKTRLREALEEVRDQKADEEKQATLVQTLKDKAPSVWAFVAPILQNVISEAVKGKLGA